MALDVGDRTIGIAVSDPMGIIAQGITTLRRTRTLAADLVALRALIDEHEVNQIVVGWPLRLNGRVGIQAKKVDVVAKAIEAEFGLPVHRWDERLSTVAAERALIEGGVRRADRKRVVDKVAATIILQGWLEAQSNRT
jgi:putative Holliday junction resolvase